MRKKWGLRPLLLEKRFKTLILNGDNETFHAGTTRRRSLDKARAPY